MKVWDRITTFGKTKGLRCRLDGDGPDERAWKEFPMCQMMEIGHDIMMQD